MVRVTAIALLVLLSGCSDKDASASGSTQATKPSSTALANPSIAKGESSASVTSVTSDTEESLQNNLYFGDLHVHTSISMDALLWGNRNGMDQAYAFAKGEPITLPSGNSSQISAPLDFVAITDHASSFETTEFCFSGTNYQDDDSQCDRFKKPSNEYFELAMKRLRQRPVKRYSAFCADDEDLCLQANSKTWQRVKDAANQANEPGEFTAFIAYEYSPALTKQGKSIATSFFEAHRRPTTRYQFLTLKQR